MHHGEPEYTNSAYGLAKLSALFGARAYADQYGLNITNLIPVNMYGPHDHFDLENSHVIPALILKFRDAIAENTDVDVWGTGKTSREFLYVKDFCRAVELALDADTGNEFINVGTGVETFITDLCAYIGQITGFSGKLKFDSSKPDGQPRRGLDVEKAKKLLGFEAHAVPVKLDVYKSIDEIEFDDPALAACVQESAKDNGWQDIGHIVSLRCNHPSGGAVVSLGGIEHLVSLADVNLAFNAISDITPLAELPNLAVIDLSHNRLSDIPVLRAADRLERLELNYNRFESLDWLETQKFLVLHSLSIAHNSLESLVPLRAAPQLHELNVRKNRLVDISPAFALTDLELADFGSNQIDSAAGLSALAKLKRLFLDRNELTSTAGLEGLIWLEELDLSSNPLTDVSSLAMLQRLQRLDLSRTDIESLGDILALGDIESLRLHGNTALSCDEVLDAITEFGAAAVRHDLTCNDGT